MLFFLSLFSLLSSVLLSFLCLSSVFRQHLERWREREWKSRELQPLRRSSRKSGREREGDGERKGGRERHRQTGRRGVRELERREGAVSRMCEAVERSVWASLQKRRDTAAAAERVCLEHAEPDLPTSSDRQTHSTDPRLAGQKKTKGRGTVWWNKQPPPPHLHKKLENKGQAGNV